MERVLITGGAGFIGSHIAERALGRGYEVVVLDNLRTGYRRNLDGLDVRFVEASVTDADAVMDAAEGAAYVFHLAAMVSVPESMHDPRGCVDINAAGTLNVLEAARRQGARKVVLSSSAAIYGDNPVMPKVETMTPEPKSPYAVTKLDGEYYLKMYADTHGVPTVSLRYFNVFGPRQDPASAYAAAVPIFIVRALRGEPITIFGDGEQTRDFVYVGDVAEANLWAATSDAEGVFNVARGGRMTINDLARGIRERLGADVEIQHGPERIGDVKHSQADVGKIVAHGFTPGYALEEALGATVDYYRRVHEGAS